MWNGGCGSGWGMVAVVGNKGWAGDGGWGGELITTG